MVKTADCSLSAQFRKLALGKGKRPCSSATTAVENAVAFTDIPAVVVVVVVVAA